MEFSVEYEPSIDADAVGDELPGGPASGSKGPDDETPDGRPIPKGHHWDGIRIVKTYKGSKRPKDISSEFWRSIGPKDRQKLIEEDAKKRSAAVKTEQAEPKKRKKKNAQETPLCQLPLVGEWEEIQESAEKTEPVPVMPCVRPAPDEPHRESLREVIKDKIRELEFKNALELYAAVARLVSKDEVSRTCKAQEAMDKEWNKLLSRGVWDQSRVRECKEIVAEARSRGETVHLGRIFEACYEKGSELPHDDPRRKFKGRTVFQGNNVHDENWDHALFAEMGSSPASMEAAKVLDAYGSQPGFSKQQADAVQAYVQALFKGTPTWVSLPGNRWPKDWEKKYCSRSALQSRSTAISAACTAKHWTSSCQRMPTRFSTCLIRRWQHPVSTEPRIIGTTMPQARHGRVCTFSPARKGMILLRTGPVSKPPCRPAEPCSSMSQCMWRQ